jgi:hypothetical protein
MTGFARRELSGPWGTLVCELRSVNHRFLESSFRLPEELRSAESDLRQNAVQALRRGKLDCTITYRPAQDAALSLEVDPSALERLIGQLDKLERTIPVGTVDLLDVLRWPGESVVVDMSSLAPDAQQARVERLAAEIESERAARGVPQWVVVEEAHRALGRRHATTLFDTSARGCVLVTWRPDELAEGTVDDVDIVVAFGSGLPEPGLVDVVARVASMDAPVVAAALADAGHRALLARRSTPGVLVALDPGPRRTAHLRHERKYEAGGVAPERRFYVRTEPDVPVGVTAGSLAELAAVLADCDPGVLRHHCPRGDFSRWIDDVFHDRMVVEEVSRVERTVRASSPSTEVESARSLLVAALARARAER